MFESSMKNGFFPFHIVSPSPWPLLTSFAIFSMMISMVKSIYFNYFFSFFFFSSLLFCIFCFMGWQKDILKESSFEGEHTYLVKKGLKMGFILIIVSEVLFFFSFFWSLFYYKISPSVILGEWPPTGVQSLPLNIPLLGTLILMSSGVSITWSHHSILENKWLSGVSSLMLTIFLGLAFTILQASEYMNSPFTIADSIYGSIFFLLTGFHGLHVIIGTIFLTVCLTRCYYMHGFSYSQHVGFEMSIWYWHFVDVVWLFLFIFLYF